MRNIRLSTGPAIDVMLQQFIFKAMLEIFTTFSFAEGLIVTTFGIAGKDELFYSIDGYMDGMVLCDCWMWSGVVQLLLPGFWDGLRCSSARDIPY